jgi:hypothetical protein
MNPLARRWSRPSFAGCQCKKFTPRQRCQPLPVLACVDIALALGHSVARLQHGWLELAACPICWPWVSGPPVQAVTPSTTVSTNAMAGRAVAAAGLAWPHCLRCPRFFEKHLDAHDPIPQHLDTPLCFLVSCLQCIIDASPTMSSYLENHTSSRPLDLTSTHPHAALQPRCDGDPPSSPGRQ